MVIERVLDVVADPEVGEVAGLAGGGTKAVPTSGVISLFDVDWII